MSGLEVAGLVLGVLPILIAAVESYKNGIQTSKIFFRKSAVVTKLTSALLLQRETLAQIVKLILLQSGCNATLEFDGNAYDCLTNGQTQERVQEYLGSSTLLTEHRQSPTDDLREIISISRNGDRGWQELVSRVKLTFSAGEISKAIQDLDNTTKSLFHLTSLIASNQQTVEQISSRKALKLGKGLRQIRRFAVELHQAILGAWKSGCHPNHEAKLFLEDRVETAANISKGMRCNADFSTTSFRLIFAASSLQKQVSWHEATIKVSRELAAEDSTPFDEPSVRQDTQVTLSLPESASTRPAGPFVKDICGVLASIERDKKQVTLVLSKNHRINTIISKDETLTSCDHAEKVPLKALLCDTGLIPRRENFPLKPRMMLALELASNLLQLSRTPWLQTPWSKDQIFFLRRPSAAGHRYEFTRPFISFTFNSNLAGTQTQQHIEPKVAFLELGILLLEIWNTETLETHFPEQQTPIKYYQRLALATKWLDDINNPPPELYDKAVSHCIRGVIGGETRFRDWEDTKFWGAVCQDIIRPLHEICKQWRSMPH